ncbi:MAG: hypothetical protein ABIH20_02720 [Candidatus Diapherotrites archaeon]
MNKIIPVVILVLLVLVSGCTNQQNSVVGTPAGETNNQDDQEPTITNPEPTPQPEPTPDSEPTVTDPDPTPDPEPTQPIGKLRSPYVCDDPIIVSTFKNLFGQDTTITKKPAPFGKTINYVTCNITQGGAVIVQLEFHETSTLETALDSMEDEARQIEEQLFDSTKETLSVGEQGYYFYSSRTGEHRIVFVDSDPLEPVFLLIRSLPGTEIEESLVKNVAQILEGLI